MLRNLLLLALLVAVAVCSKTTVRADETAPIGKPVRDFRLPEVLSNKDVRLSDFKDKVVVVIFYSYTCTFCQHYEGRFRQLAADFAGKGVVVLAIDSTDKTAAVASTAWKEKKMGFPLLKDDRARTAAALGATAITTVCIIDARGNLRYVGAFDDSETGKNIRCRFAADVVAALLTGKPLQHEQTDVFGCLIPLPQ